MIRIKLDSTLVINYEGQGNVAPGSYTYADNFGYGIEAYDKKYGTHTNVDLKNLSKWISLDPTIWNFRCH